MILKLPDELRSRLAAQAQADGKTPTPRIA
jgi:hypothetical protein